MLLVLTNQLTIMSMYKHFTLKDRFTLATLLQADYEQQDIAVFLGRSSSSIARELLRNSKVNGDYEARHAHRQASLRRQESKITSRKIENTPELAKRIEDRLDPLVSPEVIAHDEIVCHQSIYAWLARSRTDLMFKLPQHGKKRRRYGTKRAIKQGWTKHVRSINERFIGANNRSRLNHFEGDTVKLKGGALLTHTDRKSRFEIVHLAPNEGADFAQNTVCQDLYLQKAKSITYDRGSSFALWRMIEQGTGTKVFFADPRSPWQRGTNENTNQRLRRVFPKGTQYSSINREDIIKNVWLMNHTKRKCLNWHTPCQVFKRCCTST